MTAQQIISRCDLAAQRVSGSTGGSAYYATLAGNLQGEVRRLCAQLEQFDAPADALEIEFCGVTLHVIGELSSGEPAQADGAFAGPAMQPSFAVERVYVRGADVTDMMNSRLDRIGALVLEALEGAMA
jgi:hypothetical protein